MKRTRLDGEHTAMDREPKFLRVKQVARLLNCGVRTVQNLCNSGQLVSIRLPNGRGDRRISLDSVKVLLKHDGVEVDLSDFAAVTHGQGENGREDNSPSVVSIGVPFSVLNSLKLSFGKFYQAETLLLGCVLIGHHQPDVVVIDATAISDHDDMKAIEGIMSCVLQECTLILRCYDDPEVYDPRPMFPLLKACDESSTHLNQIVLAALKSKGKVPA